MNFVRCLVRAPVVSLQRVGQLKGRVALDAITAVEFVDESAFNLPHTFQVRLSSLSLALYDSPCLSRSISCCSCCKRSVNLSFLSSCVLNKYMGTG